MEANIVKGRVADAGFECFLADQNLAILNPLFTQAIGGVRLIVFEKDVAAINDLLAEEPELTEEVLAKLPSGEEEVEIVDASEKIRCENCGSTHVGYGQATKKRFGFLATVLAFITLTYPIVAKQCYHCYDCGHEFSKW